MRKVDFSAQQHTGADHVLSRNWRSTTASLAPNRSRPQIRNGSGPILSFRIELIKSFSCFTLHPLAPLAHFIGETLSILRDVFEDNFVQQYGNRIEIARECICSNA